jgi:hypothetical protein
MNNSMARVWAVALGRNLFESLPIVKGTGGSLEGSKFSGRVSAIRRFDATSNSQDTAFLEIKNHKRQITGQ